MGSWARFTGSLAVAGAMAAAMCVGWGPPAARAAGPAPVTDPAALADPFIGATPGPNMFPGATTPFGMVQWSPDTSSRPPGGGYSYDDSSLSGFSLTHESGPGCAAFGDVPFLPTVGAIGGSPGSATEPFTHTGEQASPGDYAVTTGQSPSQVHSELTVTPRTGMGRFTYPATSQANMLLKLGGSANQVDAASGQVVGDDEVVGQVTSGHLCGGGGTYTLHFAVQFNQPFAGFGTWQGSAVTPGARSVSDPRAGLYVSFDTTSQRTVLAKVGLSYVSDAGAKANLNSEDPGWDFTAIRQAAHGTWNRYLGRIGIAGGSHADQVKFYTALYHSLLHPNVFSDADGQYTGFDGKVHTVPAGHAQYATYSGWDIYRSQIQLAALLAPQQASDMAQSLVNDYQVTGQLPKRPEAGYDSYAMVGDPADPIIAGAYAFGARDFDTKAALAAMIHQATVPNNIRPGLAAEDKYGYLPMDASYGCCNFYGPVSTQLEYDTADYSIAAMAASLGDTKDARTLAGRAQNWANVFNPASGFMQPKLSSGAWQPGFDPTSQNGFVEGNSWQYTPMVPFNLRGLMTAAGGGQAWTERLDSFFTQLNAGPAAPYAWAGNEPGLEIPWEYDYAGTPWRAQDVVRRIQAQLYTTTPGGEAGNDDLGAMSSWYVWSALGMYPETPGTPILALNSPVFPQMTVHLASGHTITINAPQAAPGAPYVQQLKLNGAAWPKTYLPPSVLTQGGTLQYTLGTTPNTDWATGPDAAPPSDPTGALPAIGYAKPGQVVVQPGGQAEVTVGAQNLTGTPEKVDWTADVPDSLSLSQTSGRLEVPPGQAGTMTLTVKLNSQSGQDAGTTGAGATPGAGPIVFHFTTGTGQQLPDVFLDATLQITSPTQVTPVVSGVSPPAGSLQVLLNNPSDTSSTVKEVDWTLGDLSGTQALDTTVGPHSSKTVSVPVPSPSFGKMYPFQVASVLANGLQSNPLSGHVTFLPVVQKNLGSSWPVSQVQDGPSMDLATTADGTWVSTGSQPYGGPADLSGKVWLDWDSSDLYVTAQLTDNVFSQPYTGADIWQGDSIKMSLTSGVPGSSASVNSSSTDGQYRYGAGLTSTGAQVYRWAAPPGISTGPVTDATVHVTRDDATHTTVYELALPWSDLTSIQPVANTVFSTSLLAYDNDGSGLNGYLQWGVGIGADKNVAQFNMAQLMPASGS